MFMIRRRAHTRLTVPRKAKEKWTLMSRCVDVPLKAIQAYQSLRHTARERLWDSCVRGVPWLDEQGFSRHAPLMSTVYRRFSPLDCD